MCATGAPDARADGGTSGDMQQMIDNMRAYAPTPWEQIPDLGLYKDQVITYIERVYAPLYGAQAARLLTPSMINNYVKMGVITRPEGKKYGREQLAMLTMLVVLKQASSLEDTARLMNVDRSAGARPIYEAFCGYLTDQLRGFADSLAAADATALNLAVGAAVGSLACEAMLAAEQRARGGERPTDGTRRGEQARTRAGRA